MRKLKQYLLATRFGEWYKSVADKRWTAWTVTALRAVVGFVFVFSGFVKAIDPWGSYYKFIDYFNALGMTSWVGIALFAAFAVAALEFLLGMSLILGLYRRGAPATLLLMMAVMVPLTLYIAITDLVPDCGCFGDAVTVGNWTTFFKNILLTTALLYLLCFNKRVPCVYGPAVHWIALTFSFAFIAVIAFNGYFKQPLIDFRPFKTGKQLAIAEPAATDAADADAEEDDYVFVYEKDGNKEEFDFANVPDEDDGWNFVERRLKNDASPAETGNKSSDLVPPAAFDHGVDVTQDVYHSRGPQLLLLFPDLANVNIAHTFMINELYDFARARGASLIALTSGTDEQIAEWADISMAAYDLYGADETDLKIMARGNPAVVMLFNGKIMWKRTLSSLDPHRLHDNSVTLVDLSDDFNPQKTLRNAILYYLLAMIALLLVNRSHRIIGHFKNSKHTSDTDDDKEDESESAEEVEEEVQAQD